MPSRQIYAVMSDSMCGVNDMICSVCRSVLTPRDSSARSKYVFSGPVTTARNCTAHRRESRRDRAEIDTVLYVSCRHRAGA